MNGMVAWNFDRIMKYLPLIFRAALLGHALPNYLFLINKVAASVIIVFISSGLLFYLIASTLPFPISDTILPHHWLLDSVR